MAAYCINIDIDDRMNERRATFLFSIQFSLTKSFFLYLVWFSLCSSLFWKFRDNNVLKNTLIKASESC